MDKVGALRVAKVLLCLVFVVHLSGCATANKAKALIQLLAGTSYGDPADAQPSGPPLTIMVQKGALGKTDIQTYSPLGRDLDSELRDCLEKLRLLRSNGLSAPEASAANSPAFRASVSIELSNISDQAGNFAKGFATGFFTLGILGHIVKYDMSFVTKITMDVTRSDGTRRSYATESTTKGEFDANRDDRPQALAIMHESTQQAFRQLLDQINNDAGFWTGG